MGTQLDLFAERTLVDQSSLAVREGLERSFQIGTIVIQAVRHWPGLTTQQLAKKYRGCQEEDWPDIDYEEFARELVDLESKEEWMKLQDGLWWPKVEE